MLSRNRFLVSGLFARLSRADRGDDLAGRSREHRGPRKRKRTPDNEYRSTERTAKAAGGPEQHESGENTGTREGWHADRRQGCPFLKTAVGGHSVGADTLVSLTAEEKLPSSEEEDNDDDDDDGQPGKKQRRVAEERQDILEAECNAEPAGCHSERGTPLEESRDRTWSLVNCVWYLRRGFVVSRRHA